MVVWRFFFSFLFFPLFLGGCACEPEASYTTCSCVGSAYLDLNSVPQRAEAACPRMEGDERRRQVMDQQDMTLEKQQLKQTLKKMQGTVQQKSAPSNASP